MAKFLFRGFLHVDFIIVVFGIRRKRRRRCLKIFSNAFDFFVGFVGFGFFHGSLPPFDALKDSHFFGFELVFSYLDFVEKYKTLNFRVLCRNLNLGDRYATSRLRVFQTMLLFHETFLGIA